jgi:hypothetical protein
MVRFARTFVIASAWLLPLFAIAQAIKPELIRTSTGATVVFNTVDSFFAADVTGDNIKPAPGTDGFFQVDDRLLRVSNTPDKELAQGAGSRVLLPKEILQLQFKRDLDEEQFSLQRPIRETKQEILTLSKGRIVLHWWFSMPSGSQGGATQHHYMSTVCNREVFTICAPLLPKDTQDALREFMLATMNTVRESNDPINVKEYAKELQQADQ